jgi:hypothetical protein
LVVIRVPRLHEVVIMMVITIPVAICVAQDGRFLVRIVSLHHLGSVGSVEVSLVQIIPQKILNKDGPRVTVVLHFLTEKLLEIVIVLAENSVVFLCEHFENTVILCARIG